MQAKLAIFTRPQLNHARDCVKTVEILSGLDTFHAKFV